MCPTAMACSVLRVWSSSAISLAFTCYMQGVKLIGAQKASLYSFAEPVTAAIISTFVLGSPFTMWDALGFACIFIMLVLLSLPEKKRSGVETAC